MMNPERAVLIDQWIGTPLCAVATLASRLRKRDVPKEPPDALVFIEIAEIGALFVAYPAVALARRLFPETTIHFITSPAGREALRIMGFRDEEILLLRIDGLSGLASDSRAIRSRLRGYRRLATVNLEPFARFSALLAWYLGGRTRVGFHRFLDEGNYTGDLLTHRVIWNSQQHASQTFLSLVHALASPPGREPGPKEPVPLPLEERIRVEPSAEAMADVRGKLQRAYPGLDDGHQVVLLNANTSDIFPLRRWPEEKFIALARRLLEAERRVVVLTGTAAERPRGETIRKGLATDRALNMAGETTMRELLALYRVADLLITNDSGPAHFSGAVDAPALVLFGPETPNAWRPLNPNARVVYQDLACSPCISPHNHKRSTCTDNQCMQRLDVERVLAEAEAMLAARPGTHA